MHLPLKNHRPTREETRARIMDQAAALFRQFGYSKTTVADIARELDMSPANIYKFFPSKNAIIQAGADRNLCQIKEDLTRVVRTKKGAGNRLLGVILTIYRFHQDHFRHERQIYKLVIAATEENWPCVRMFKEFLTQIVTKVIEDGIRTGEFRRMDAAAATGVLLDCFTWITNALLFKELNPNEVEGRARAQVQLLKKALE
jgi:TetR/AcrR family transcriptional regulator, repressor of the ameABC operon